MNVDSHHHLWVPNPRRYPWLARPELAAVNRPFGLAGLTEATASAGIGATVVVQAADDTNETRELLRLARGTMVAAVVGWLDLAGPDAVAQLSRLRTGPGGERLAGLRVNLRDDADPGWLAGPVPATALHRLAAADLTLDVLAGPPALPAVATLAVAHPALRVILDHAGHPPSSADAAGFAAWETAMRRLGGCPNVAVKFSGLAGRPLAALRPVAETLAVAFGEGRVLFGSDWPLCLLSAGYADVVAKAREALSDLDRRLVFAANAMTWYRLQQGQGGA